MHHNLHFDKTKILLVLSNSVDPDKILNYAAFIWIFSDCKTAHLQVGKIRWINLGDRVLNVTGVCQADSCLFWQVRIYSFIWSKNVYI